MLKTAKDLTFIGLTTALLIAGQFVLSSVKGVEVVTVLLLSFCYAFGAKRGIFAATAFSLIRCIFFGFFPTVIILYLVYYNLFAIVTGNLGKLLKKFRIFAQSVIFAFTAAFLTAGFTLLDDIITPLYFGYTADAAKAYFIASLPVMLPQIVCAFVTVIILFPPLSRVYLKFGQ